MTAEPVLAVENLTLQFGGVTASSDVSFSVDPGSVVGLIGPNGAGKTSAFNCMTGNYRPTSGSIRLNGVEVTAMAPHNIARLGVSRTFQTPSLFQGLSVLENVLAGCYMHGRSGALAGLMRLPKVVREEVAQRERAEEILELLDLQQHRHSDVVDLPYGMQKRVELGRAVVRDAGLLLLDEPMAGMTLEEKQDMSAFILAVRAQGSTTVLIVEHDMGVMMKLAEHLVVLDFGRRIGYGTPAEVRKNRAVIEAYLGDADHGSSVAPTGAAL